MSERDPQIEPSRMTAFGMYTAILLGGAAAAGAAAYGAKKYIEHRRKTEEYKDETPEDFSENI